MIASSNGVCHTVMQHSTVHIFSRVDISWTFLYDEVAYGYIGATECSLTEQQRTTYRKVHVISYDCEDVGL